MSVVPLTLNGDDLQVVLSATLRQVDGPAVWLEEWTAQPLTKHGTHRVVRYDVRARTPAGPEVRCHQWVGKFYDRDDDARRVAAVLRQLASTDCSARGAMVIPRVLGYDAARRLLLQTYEAGDSVTSTIAHDRGPVLPAIGRALAALHATPVTVETCKTAAVVLEDVRLRIPDLCARFPEEAASLRQAWSRLERDAPVGPAVPCFVHGDVGPANLLWRSGSLVVLDFDKCTRGDPALDLGNLLTQLRRLTLRKPGKLPEFGSLRRAILQAYQGWSAPDAGLLSRVAFYEQATLLRKIHSLAFDPGRHAEAAALERRQAEAAGLLDCLR